MTNNTVLSYGIGEDYLKDWDIPEALREVYQNFIDYGKYTTNYRSISKSKFRLTIKNDFVAETLEFLQIGKSVKHNDLSIGKHGEGLKMAFLVFLRKGINIQIITNNFVIYPVWINQEYIGKTLGLSIVNLKKSYKGFKVIITPNISHSFKFADYITDIITEKDISYKDSYHGSILNKPIGRLYSGGLYVTTLNNLKKSYDIPPNLLSLDRDRRIPSSFEVSYHTSKINESKLKSETDSVRINFKDTDYDDMKYVSYVPPSQYKDIKVKEVLGKPEFVTSVINEETKEVEEVIIQNDNIKEYLRNQSIFAKAINSIKDYLLSKLGIKELIINFRKKYCHSDDMKREFDEIVNRLGIKLE